MDDKFKAVQSYDWGQSRVPLLAIDRQIRDVYGHPEHLAKVEESLLEVLNSDASLGAKRFVCQKLSVIGSEKSVPVLAVMLTNADTSDMARYALERIPADSVDKAFRGALDSTSGKIKAGIIDSIAMRKNCEAISKLAELLSASDSQIASAAAWALGEIGASAAVEQLAKMKDIAKGEVRAAIQHSILASAERLAAEGNKSQAASIYSDLSNDDAPDAIRHAAQHALQTTTTSVIRRT